MRKILEGPAEDGKVFITEQILLAIQVKGDWESCHPLVCWSLQLQVRFDNLSFCGSTVSFFSHQID